MLIEKEKVIQNTLHNFRNGLYCAESVVRSFNDCLHLKLSEDSIKMATSFSAGLGGSKCCCGCLSGGAMIIGALVGRLNSNESASKAFRLTRKMHDEFKSRYRYTCCRVLTKNVQWTSPERHILCEKYVCGASDILYDLLLDVLS